MCLPALQLPTALIYVCNEWESVARLIRISFFFEINIQSTTSNNDDKGVSVYKPRVMYFCCGS